MGQRAYGTFFIFSFPFGSAIEPHSACIFETRPECRGFAARARGGGASWSQPGGVTAAEGARLAMA